MADAKLMYDREKTLAVKIIYIIQQQNERFGARFGPQTERLTKCVSWPGRLEHSFPMAKKEVVVECAQCLARQATENHPQRPFYIVVGHLRVVEGDMNSAIGAGVQEIAQSDQGTG